MNKNVVKNREISPLKIIVALQINLPSRSAFLLADLTNFSLHNHFDAFLSYLFLSTSPLFSLIFSCTDFSILFGFNGHYKFYYVDISLKLLYFCVAGLVTQKSRKYSRQNEEICPSTQLSTFIGGRSTASYEKWNVRGSMLNIEKKNLPLDSPVQEYIGIGHCASQ